MSFVYKEEKLLETLNSFVEELITIVYLLLTIYFAKTLSSIRLLIALCSIDIAFKSSL